MANDAILLERFHNLPNAAILEFRNGELFDVDHFVSHVLYVNGVQYRTCSSIANGVYWYSRDILNVKPQYVGWNDIEIALRAAGYCLSFAYRAHTSSFYIITKQAYAGSVGEWHNDLSLPAQERLT